MTLNWHQESTSKLKQIKTRSFTPHIYSSHLNLNNSSVSSTERLHLPALKEGKIPAWFPYCTVAAQSVCVGVTGGGGFSIYVMEELVLSSACKEQEQNRKDTERGRRWGERGKHEREREQWGGWGSHHYWHTCTHMHASNWVTPFPHYSHVHATGKQQKLEGLEHWCTDFNRTMAACPTFQQLEYIVWSIQDPFLLYRSTSPLEWNPVIIQSQCQSAC